MKGTTIICRIPDFLKGDDEMKQFDYTIRNPQGMDLRRMGLLAKLAKHYEGTAITIAKGNQAANAGQLMRMMRMSVRCGDRIVVTVDGPAEDGAFFNMRRFCESNL